MDGRAFLDIADELAAGGTEAHWRAAVGRAYYALLHEGMAALDRWGFPIPPKEDLHRYVRLRLTYPADADLKKAGDTLERLSRLRNYADYQLASPGQFTSAREANSSVAAIKAAFPP